MVAQITGSGNYETVILYKSIVLCFAGHKNFISHRIEILVSLQLGVQTQCEVLPNWVPKFHKLNTPVSCYNTHK